MKIALGRSHEYNDICEQMLEQGDTNQPHHHKVLTYFYFS